jgi:hypothetical protein
MSARTQGDTPLMSALNVIGMGLIATSAVGALILGEPLFAALMLTIGAASYFARRCSHLDTQLAHCTLDAAGLRHALDACKTERNDALGELARRDIEVGAR